MWCGVWCGGDHSYVCGMYHAGSYTPSLLPAPKYHRQMEEIFDLCVYIFYFISVHVLVIILTESHGTMNLDPTSETSRFTLNSQIREMVVGEEFPNIQVQV